MSFKLPWVLKNGGVVEFKGQYAFSIAGAQNPGNKNHAFSSTEEFTLLKQGIVELLNSDWLSRHHTVASLVQLEKIKR